MRRSCPSHGQERLFCCELPRRERTAGADRLARGHEAPIPYIHGVTAPAAVRLALPELPVALWRPSYDAIWQVGAAIQSAYGAGPSRPMPAATGAAEREDLIDRAVATNDEHAIKFTEACLRQYLEIPDPLFLLAAEDAINRLG